MSIDEFVNKYNGVHVDEDGYYGAQCWDLVARYAREVVGCPSFWTGSGGAEGLFRVFAQPIPQYFDRIANNPNDPNQLPARGDVIVWEASFSPPWGHTALVLSADKNGVTVLEQNGNNPNGKAYTTKRGWSKVSGWLRPKGVSKVMFKEGERVDMNVILFGSDRGYFKEFVGQEFRQAWYNIKDSDAFRRNHYVNKGDLTNYLGRIPTVPETQEFQIQLGEGLDLAKKGGGVPHKDTVYNLIRTGRFEATAKTAELGRQLTEANGTITTLRVQIDELSKRPTPEAVEAIKKTLAEAEARALENQKKLEEYQKEDQATENAILKWLKGLFRLGNKES